MTKLKRGEVRDGMVFWSYHPTAKNGEYWITQHAFTLKRQKKSKQRPEEQRRRNNEKRKIRYASNEGLREKLRLLNADRYKGLKATGEIKAIRANHHKKRMQNPVYYLQKVCRARIWAALNGIGGKPTKTEIMLGCTFTELRAHLELMFKDGMNWSNKGKWHIDHIVPLSSAKTQDEVIRLCHFKNLQPLWERDNKKKGNKQ